MATESFPRTRPIDFSNQEEVAEVKNELIAFIGPEKLNKFIWAAHRSSHLLFWQEMILRQFAEKHGLTFPLDHESVYMFFCEEICNMSTVFNDYNKKFYAGLFPELGPEKCRHEKCGRMTTALSIFCAKHHYENIVKKPCPWSGPPNLSEDERKALEREEISRAERRPSKDFGSMRGFTLNKVRLNDNCWIIEGAFDRKELSLRPCAESESGKAVFYKDVPLWISYSSDIRDLNIYLAEYKEGASYELVCRDERGDFFYYGGWDTLEEALAWLRNPFRISHFR